ncbi:uncharacterized protein TrAtP1_007407 [Trichoderma atroviride]|uniref:uncharacterized protein n=1 Tax=Hypocrea atroviridis TaxID=63577 RepID=UPI00331C8F6C|nr:hypothetical protein TrAtP1_007407 [Trichoderma atroviride]
MEDHIVGHLLLLALKSLPSYEEPTEEQTQSEGGQCELSSSSARTRSTIEQMSECSSSACSSTIETAYEKHVLMDLKDTGKQQSSSHRSDGSSKYKAWGGFRNYVSQFANGATLPPPNSRLIFASNPTLCPTA